MVPILMTGAISLMLRSFPIPVFQEFLQTAGAGILSDEGIIFYILGFIYDSTFGFMSAYIVLSISYYYSSTFDVKNFSLQIISMLVSLSCFLASFGGVSGSLELEHFGPIGVFTAMVCAILGTKLFYEFSKLFSRLFKVPLVASDISFRNSSIALIPLVLSLLVFIGINFFINSVFNVSNFNDLISKGLSQIFIHLGNDLASGVIYLLVLNLLWFFGIHGGNAMEAVAREVFVPANADPNAIISKTFMDNFALIGGAGATICLLFALLLASRTRANRHLAYSSAPVALFNINEPLIYGLPIVFNPIVVVPFLLVPVVSLIIGYMATKLGAIPIIVEGDVLGVQGVTTTGIPWTTPPFFSGYLMTGSPMGSVIQLIIVTLGTLIYYPFVRLSEKLQNSRKSMLIRQMTDIFQQRGAEVSPTAFLDRNDDIGILAKSMALQLREDAQNKRIEMHYMPQLDTQNRVTGAEALLRWQFEDQPIFPPLAVAISQEDRFYNELTYAIVSQVSEDIRTFEKMTGETVRVSVNINAEQLNDEDFLQTMINIAENQNIAQSLILEITEESSIMFHEKTPVHIDRLHERGIAIAIDDFSMGQTSLKYLQHNHFDYVKLDGFLVKQITENIRCRSIIQSIIHLGHELGFSIVAEYVENDEIKEELIKLGCQYFQGYLYSPALPSTDFLDYFKHINH